MGVSYRGVICVGYEYNEIESFYEDSVDDDGNYKYESIYDFTEELGIESYGPYYDADKQDCIYGKAIERASDYCHTEVSNLDERIAEAKDELEKQFGIKPKAYLMAQGW